MELLERDGELAAVEAALRESRDAGRVVVVVGEAGIGKTALLAAAVSGSARVLWGGCDPLVTPRPMGPLRDVARQAGGALAAAVEGSREDLLTAVLDELAAGVPLVVDDLHWADDATLDLVALLGRRLARSPGCLLVACRGDALGGRPEVRRVLAALPRECARLVEPQALSTEAVAALARQAGRHAGELHAVTGGNPFFVTEALAAPGDGVPASVRDAVALRTAALAEDARAALELAAVVPGPAEPWLIAAAAGAGEAAIDECIAAGLLALRGEALAFRHDLARRAVEQDIAPLRRRSLDAAVLRALKERGGADPARLAHHARRAGDAEAIRRHAPAAARAASAAAGHRQAVEQGEAAGAAGPGAPGRAEALEGIAVEAYLCGHPERALEARRALLEIHEAADDALAAGDDLRWLARVLWWSGRSEEAAEAGDRAIAALEAFPGSRQLAMALSGRSQLAMLSDRHEEAIALGNRAVELARRIGDRETEAHALTNVGSAALNGPEYERGRALLDEAFALAVAGGFDDHAARALVNLATSTLMRRRDDPRMTGDMARALAFARERELGGYVQYLLGGRANLRLLRGDWPGAEADARESLALGEQPGVSLCPALVALGRLQARRGDPEAQATLEEAWRRAVQTGELQRLAPVAAARAEHAWLEGDMSDAVGLARETYELAVARDEPWGCDELAFWLWRPGEPPPGGGVTPYALSIAGDWRGAAAGWEALAFQYERAEALSEADRPEARLEALAILDSLGAERAAARLRRRLRADGLRHIPRGPRPATRAGLGGLTPRQVEVLDLIVSGATNAEIAEALVITPKTVDHHVSAVLAKLGVASRREAGAAAARLATRAG